MCLAVAHHKRENKTHTHTAPQANIMYLNATDDWTGSLPELTFSLGMSVQGVLHVSASQISIAGSYHVDFVQVRQKHSCSLCHIRL